MIEWDATAYDSRLAWNLSMACETGSRPVDDPIHGHEERCQEQEGVLPRSSTLQDLVEEELGYSP